MNDAANGMGKGNGLMRYWPIVALFVTIGGTGITSWAKIRENAKDLAAHIQLADAAKERSDRDLDRVRTKVEKNEDDIDRLERQDQAIRSTIERETLILRNEIQKIGRDQDANFKELKSIIVEQNGN